MEYRLRVRKRTIAVAVPRSVPIDSGDRDRSLEKKDGTANAGGESISGSALQP